MTRVDLETRRDTLRRQLREAQAVVLRLQGALAILDELLPAPGLSEVLPDGMELDDAEG